MLDRVFTYARNEALTNKQLQQLYDEDLAFNENLSVSNLIHRFETQVDAALEQLKQTDEKTLTEFRAVGRKRLPSTVIGLLVHAAEHTMRHLGQLRVTVKILAK